MGCLGDGISGREGIRMSILVRLLGVLDLLESTYLFIFTQWTNRVTLHCKLIMHHLILWWDLSTYHRSASSLGYEFSSSNRTCTADTCVNGGEILIPKRPTPRASARAVSCVNYGSQTGNWKMEGQALNLLSVLRISNASQNIKMPVETHGSAATLMQKHVLVGGQVFGMTSKM